MVIVMQQEESWDGYQDVLVVLLLSSLPGFIRFGDRNTRKPEDSNEESITVLVLGFAYMWSLLVLSTRSSHASILCMLYISVTV